MTLRAFSRHLFVSVPIVLLLGLCATPASAQDADGDGVLDPDDNCAYVFNPLQIDQDFDNVGDVCDCAPARPDQFQTLGPAQRLVFTSKTDMAWEPPVETGGPTLMFDLLRTDHTFDFSNATCVASDLTDTIASDPTVPSHLSFYLLRAQGECGGNLGAGAQEWRRFGAPCPPGPPAPECTENHENLTACPNQNPTCGGFYSGGAGCLFASAPNCYSSGIRSYGVSQFGPPLTIDFAEDVHRLSVFLAHQGPGAFGLMRFFDADNLEVGPPIFANGDCAQFMPPEQLVGFTRPVRSVLVEAFEGPVWIDDLTVNPNRTTLGEFQIGPLDWFGAPSPPWGEISFQLFHRGPGTGVEYLNVIDPLQGGAPEGWLIQNFPMPPDAEPGRYATTVDLGGFLFEGPLEMFVGNEGFPVSPTPGDGLPVFPQPGFATYDADDLNGRPGGPPAPPDPPQQNGTVSFNLPLGFGRGTHHVGMPDKAQGVNECAPTSTANSFVWLDQTYDTVDLPDAVDDTCEVRDKLKNKDHMKTSKTDGTTDGNMIKGKLQFIADNNLPLTVEFQDDGLGGSDITHAGKTAKAQGTKPTFDWIFEQLQKGQDVELGMTWKGGGGHWVTLTGAFEFFGVKMISYNDPDDKKTQTKFSFLGESEENAGFLEVESEADNTVDIVVAESPAD